MKKIIFLFLLLASIFFVSCKSNKPKDLIVKKWKITNIELPGMPLSDSDKASLMKGTMEFTKDGKMMLTDMENNRTGTYSISDDGKILTVTTDGKPETNDIVELTASRMILVDKTNKSKLTVVPR